MFLKHMQLNEHHHIVEKPLVDLCEKKFSLIYQCNFHFLEPSLYLSCIDLINETDAVRRNIPGSLSPKQKIFSHLVQKNNDKLQP
jgi:hypothetical protein